MDMENRSRTTLALPNPQVHSRGSEIELLEVPFHDSSLPKRDASPPLQTWLIFLKRELEFLGVTQILIGFVCLYFGTVIYFGLKISGFEKDFFSSFQAGYPFWGAVIFAISGFLSIMSEKKNATYLVHGSLGANLASSIAAGIGIFILVSNLKSCLAYNDICQEAYEDNFCIAAFSSTVIVALVLCLTILGLGVAVLLIVYRVGELFKEDKIPEECLYEELNIDSSIYSDLEDRPKASPTDS